MPDPIPTTNLGNVSPPAARRRKKKGRSPYSVRARAMEDLTRRLIANRTLTGGFLPGGELVQARTPSEARALQPGGYPGLPSGVDMGGRADYRRMHQPDVRMPAPLPAPPARQRSGAELLANMIRDADQLPTQAYHLPMETEQVRQQMGRDVTPGDPLTALLPQMARRQANRNYARAMQRAMTAASEHPESALPLYPGPMVGAQSPSMVQRKAKDTKKIASHRAAEKDRVAGRQFLLRMKRIGLPGEQLAYTDALAREETPPEHLLAKLMGPEYLAGKAQQTLADAEMAQADPLYAAMGGIGQWAGQQAMEGVPGPSPLALQGVLKAIRNAIGGGQGGGAAPRDARLPGETEIPPEDVAAAVAMAGEEGNPADILETVFGHSRDKTEEVMSAIAPPPEESMFPLLPGSPRNTFDLPEGIIPGMAATALNMLDEMGAAGFGQRAGENWDLPFAPTSAEMPGGMARLPDQAMDQLVKLAKTDPEMRKVLVNWANGGDPRAVLALMGMGPPAK